MPTDSGEGGSGDAAQLEGPVDMAPQNAGMRVSGDSGDGDEPGSCGIRVWRASPAPGRPP